MDSSIIITLIIAATSIVISFCFGYLPRVRKKRIEELEKRCLALAKDVAQFYSIESLLLDELSQDKNKSKETLKRAFRKRVSEEMGYPLSHFSKPAEIKAYLNKV